MLRKQFRLDERIVEIASTVEHDGSLPLQANNKVVLSLINIERETHAQSGGGIGGTPDAGPGPNGTGQAGTANRGGGAGAAVRTGQVGAGGKGIVIVQY